MHLLYAFDMLWQFRCTFWYVGMTWCCFGVSLLNIKWHGYVAWLYFRAFSGMLLVFLECS